MKANYKPIETEINSLSDSETLSFIIGNKNNKCQSLLEKVDYSLKDLARLSISDLIKMGLTPREARAVVAAIELGRRKSVEEGMERKQIKRSQDIADIFVPLLSDLMHEEFHVLFLNRSNKIIKRMKVSQGGLSGTVTDVRIIFKEAINCLTSAIIVCHNHPSGNLKPSESDTRITQKIKESGALLDIQLLDHIIVGGDEYFSYADNGLL